MTLFQETGGDPRADASAFADLLAFYGALGDAAFGSPHGTSARVAATAASLAQVVGLQPEERDTVFVAGALHAVGAIGNRAHRAGESLPERIARMENWDVPAQGARACEEIAELPKGVADLVRWQSERWDGTGAPDQLRWHGIPRDAVVLSLAKTYVACDDSEEALTVVSDGAGRVHAPELARAFTLWFHSTDGAVDPLPFPLDALALATAASNAALFDRIADRIDAHLACDGRWRRIARLCDGTAVALGLPETDRRALAIAARAYGGGEIESTPAAHDRSEAAFDPLARLGIEDRAGHAVAGARLLETVAVLRPAAAIVRARAEWFDGTGKPDGLLQKAIAPAAGILAAAIAYDGLDHKDRIDGAAGTQFDPRVVRAILETAKARA